MKELMEPIREKDVLRYSLEGLRGDLPRNWRWQVEERPKSVPGRFDAIVEIESPGGQKAMLAVEAKRLVLGRDVSQMLAQIEKKIATAGLKNAIPLLVGRYLPPSPRERLEGLGVSYADATGNRLLTLEQPALFVRSAGENRDPWRGPGRPRGTLKGAPAAKVARWLADNRPPYTALQIAGGSGASTGATYRVLRFLEEEGLIERAPGGAVTSVEWRPLLERGSRDFGFQRTEPVESLLFPRGLDALVETLRAPPSLRYGLTGSLAAKRYEAYAATRFAMLYADDVEEVIRKLDLRRVDAGANVLVAVDRDEVAFVRAGELDGVRLAAPSQIAVDLLSGPGRSPSEGEALMDWMESNERDWRS